MAIDHDALTTAPWHHRAAAAVAVASTPPRHIVHWIPILIAVGVSAFSVAVLAKVDEASLSHASASTAAALIDLAAGLGMIVAGSLAWREPQRASLGLLAMAMSVTWLSVDWIGWADGPALVRTVALVFAPFIVPLVVHLSASFPGGRLGNRRDRSLVSIVYGVTVFTTLALALFRDPFLDRYCWNNCTDNSFLVRAQPDLARSLTLFWQYFSLVACVAVAIACTWRLITATPTARRMLVAVLGPVVALATSIAVRAGVLIATPAERAGRQPFSALFLARAGSVVCLAAGIIWVVISERRTRRAVARLADELGAAPPPGSLRNALARLLGDDGLEVAYRLPLTDTYVDAGGEQVQPRAGPAQLVTPITRNGEPVAVVIHDRSLQATHDLAAEIGAASRLAVDNERLLAQNMAQLADLRASRTRIVETADSTRRRLERDLHDGAQQRLLALSYEIQLGEADAIAAGNMRLAGVLATASEEAIAALVELRDLAHGIFPVILSEAGLGPALASFVDTVPLRVELRAVPQSRLADATEIAAYSAVTAAIEVAVNRSASRIMVTFSSTDAGLDIELIDDGADRNVDDLVNVADRVGALGGHLDVAGSRVRAVIPCG